MWGGLTYKEERITTNPMTLAKIHSVFLLEHPKILAIVSTFDLNGPKTVQGLSAGSLVSVFAIRGLKMKKVGSNHFTGVSTGDG